MLETINAGLRFHKLPNIDAISNISINDISRDQYGYIWIATEDGLNRYDGYTIKTYRPSNIYKNSLSHSYITATLVDHEGRLIIGTKSGVNIYNAESDSFFKIGEQPSELSEASVVKLFEDAQHRLWISTQRQGIFLTSPDRKVINKIPFDLNLGNGEAIYSRDIIELVDERILIATNIGILTYSNENESISRYHFQNIDEHTDKLNITTFDIGAANFLLFGTTNGIYKLDLNSNVLTELFPQQLSNTLITSVKFINNEEILVGTRSDGLFHINQSSGLIRNYRSDSTKYSLIDDQVAVIKSTGKNIVLIGTNTGLNALDISKNSFTHLRSISDQSDCLSGNLIFSVLKDKLDRVWIAPFGQGLNQINLKKQTCRKIAFNSDSFAKNPIDNIVSMDIIDSKYLWIGTYNEGVFLYDIAADQLFTLETLATSTDGAFPKYITKIKSDPAGSNIWISTHENGMYRFNLNLHELKNFKPNAIQSQSIPITSIKSFDFDESGTLWLATNHDGVWKLDPSTQSIKPVSQINSDNRLKTISFNSATFDNQKNLWLGSKETGAIKYTESSGEIKVYSIDDGLLSNVVLNIQQDNSGDMWFFTDKGLLRLSHSDEHMVTFLEDDGLQADAFTTAGFFDKASGVMWTGGINGLNYFKPANVNLNDLPNIVTVTGFDLFYHAVEISDDEYNSPLKTSISTTKSLNLRFDQNVFTFSFSSIQVLSPQRIKYQFKLDGNDATWNTVSSDRHYANYNNIDPGNYKFRVKASNKFGEWNDIETTIDITITPPWWKTNYAYMVYIILSILSLYTFIKIRTNVLEQRAKTLEATVTQRTIELASEKSKVEQLLSRKNEEFANVSHEFRTPLTLILGPLAQIIKTNKNKVEQDKLGVIQRNGYRLLRMVDQLLNMETFRIKSITQKAPQAIGRTVTLLTEAFADLAQEKGIQLTLTKKLNINFEFTPDALEKILLNLLSNAVKYTKPGGQIQVSAERTKNNEFKLTVSDSGIGIPQDKLQSVFERYSRVLDENAEQVAGAGIGLALVKELVEAHQGHIEISSELGKGTTIGVYLPIIGEVDDEQVNLHSNDEILAMELMGLTNQAAQQLSDNQDTQSQMASNKPSVLVIEDNADMRNYIVSSIQDEYQVLTAKDGEEGTALAIEQVPDLIISDIMMPRKDGYQTTQALRNHDATNHIPIVLLTARGDRESRLKGWYEKADEYLTKPFDVDELKIRLKNLLDIREILRKRFAETAFEQTEIIQPESTEDLEGNIENLQIGFIRQLNEKLETLHSKSSLSIVEIATSLHMSERQLFRKVKSVLDMSPLDYLRRFRLEKAKALLMEGKNASFSAYEVGFSTQSHFGKCFKAQFGMSPGEFVKSLHY